MSVKEFISNLRDDPEEIAFSDTIAVIDENYSFNPTAFKNGDIENASGQNSGSCKLFAFAKFHALSEKETLACFGSYYRNDVLDNPDGDDHQNIRNFMNTGWEGIVFENSPLSRK